MRLAWRTSAVGCSALCGLAVFTAAIPIGLIWLTKQLVDLIAGERSGSVRPSSYVPVVVGLALLATFQRVLQVVQTNRQQHFSRMVGCYADRLFLKKAATVDLGYFDDPDWHDRMERAARDLQFRPGQLVYSVLALFGSIITIAGMFGILLRLHPALLALTLTSLIVSFPIQKSINARLYGFYHSNTRDQREQTYFRWLLSDSRQAKEVRAYQLGDYLLDQQQTLARQWLERLNMILRRSDMYAVLSGIFSALCLTVGYLFLVRRALSGTASPGELVAALGAVSGVLAQVGAAFSSLLSVDQSAQFLDDFFSFLSAKPLLTVTQDPKGLPATGLDVQFECVTFQYPGAPRACLTETSLHISPGELVAIVGDNGAGKTSLIKLLLRFYEPTSGVIRVGGVDVREVDPDALRNRIGVLFQDYGTYSLSIRENVGFGRLDAMRDSTRLDAALEGAHADRLVSTLPNGVESNVGRLREGGLDLSGGEWQRLALARLLFRDADLWILDEPTAALDAMVEAEIFSEFRSLLRGRTGLLISHRFSTVRVADRIVVLERGMVTEVGTHDELVLLGGRYAALFEAQATGYR